jgi:hypothetical protein
VLVERGEGRLQQHTACRLKENAMANVNSTDPAEKFLSMVAMAFDHAERFRSVGMFLTCLATMSLACRHFHAVIAEQGLRLH